MKKEKKKLNNGPGGRKELSGTMTRGTKRKTAREETSMSREKIMIDDTRKETPTGKKSEYR